MTMCNKMFRDASKKLSCPIRIFPMCHPDSHIEAFVIAKKRQVLITCGKCERTVLTIKVNENKLATIKRRKSPKR